MDLKAEKERNSEKIKELRTLSEDQMRLLQDFETEFSNKDKQLAEKENQLKNMYIHLKEKETSSAKLIGLLRDRMQSDIDKLQ